MAADIHTSWQRARRRIEVEFKHLTSGKDRYTSMLEVPFRHSTSNQDDHNAIPDHGVLCLRRSQWTWLDGRVSASSPISAALRVQGEALTFQMGLRIELSDPSRVPPMEYHAEFRSAQGANTDNDVQVVDAQDVINDLHEIGLQDIAATIKPSFYGNRHTQWIDATAQERSSVASLCHTTSRIGSDIEGPPEAQVPLTEPVVQAAHAETETA